MRENYGKINSMKNTVEMRNILLSVFSLLLLQATVYSNDAVVVEEKIQDGAILLRDNIIRENNIENSTIEEILPNKYTIIKTISNYSPIRENADVNAKRFSHLKKGATIFADDSNEDFYRVDLGLNKPYWIEKKYVDVSSSTNQKELPEIKDIILSDTDKYYTIKVKTPILTAYNEIEKTDKSLEFILYDVIFDEKSLKAKGKSEANFDISKDEFNNLKILYSSKYILTGHDVEKTPDGLLIKIKKPFSVSKKHPLKGITIAIDPGHGGGDSGACANGLREKDINLQVSKILSEKLKDEGAKVYLTREDDVDVDLYDRIDFAKINNADFLISIHQNSLPNRANVDKKHGVGVYYYNKEAYKLANEIQKSLVEGTEFRDDGVNFASFALTRSSLPVCILVECGYIIHKEEAKKLSDAEFQKLLSDYLIKGIKNYLVENF